MDSEKFLNTVTNEFQKVSKEHAEMKDSFNEVNAQHDEMIKALKKVEKQHNTMNNELADMKAMLQQLLNKEK
jgi:septal ring factor EnvC (AmiA/AmiB activator)